MTSGTKGANMNLEFLIEFVPELHDLFIKRYELLKYISINGRVGRRTIAQGMDISERVVRDEIEKLKAQDFIAVSSFGIEILEKGSKFISELSSVYREMNSLRSLSIEVEKCLGVKSVFIVESGTHAETVKNLGAQAAIVFEDHISKGELIGVTGGETIYSVSESIVSRDEKFDVTVIPARGSVGSQARFQANTIASRIANKLNAKLQLLPIPETVSKQAMEIFLSDSEMREAYEMLKSLDVLLFGIGRADVMLARRGINEEKSSKVLNCGAVSEAFGNYFNLKGDRVYSQESVGISLDKFLSIPKIIGVAGGVEKAQAIISISTLRPDMVLVIDESAAHEIIKEVNYGS
ncbi:sugar-binding transcriptional regulator [Peptoniphilus indolicus]|uniref:Transcriptional regulator n=2 Tax=Peptoniphilus indolicus TaxID=33030 RepID=G4D136_9FIRM|nr:sugar-binding domain-containing protein [Peptoniphilus indolicus]EGY80769.1 transcriptional regulator [Peptoniphilus indolicus ATCC 29427]SUB74817.1 Central glycolytic genes regulator [Peptoniphilus indolicus]